MDLNCNMSSLFISSKKRRLSGLLRCPAPADYEEPTEPQQTTISKNANLPEEIPCCVASSSRGLPESSNFTVQSPSETSLTSDEMGKAVNNLDVRRSSRRKSVINIDTSASSIVSHVQEFDIEHDLKALKKIYLDKRVKKGTPSLETIFETPADNEKIMSSRKFKRIISFQELQKNKVKKRPLKAKQSIAKYNKLKQKNRVSMDTLLQKLNSLERD